MQGTLSALYIKLLPVGFCHNNIFLFDNFSIGSLKGSQGYHIGYMDKKKNQTERAIGITSIGKRLLMQTFLGHTLFPSARHVPTVHLPQGHLRTPPPPSRHLPPGHLPPCYC